MASRQIRPRMGDRMRGLARGLMLLAGAALAGCAGEQVPYNAPPQVKMTGKFACFSNAEDTLDKFFAGGLPDNEVAAFWDCFDFAIVQFVKIVNGKDGKNYTPGEIAKFLDDFFLEGRNLRSETEFLAELMHIKRLFVGGSLESVNHQDLMVRTRELVREFKAISLQLNSHMYVIHEGLTKSGQKSGLRLEQVKSAERAVRGAARRIGQLVENRQHTYSFTRLLAFLTQLEKVIQHKRPDFSFSVTKKYMPFLSELKGLLVSPPQDLVRQEDWGRLFDLIGVVVGWGLKYRLMVEEQDWSFGQAFSAIETIITEAFVELDSGLRTQRDQTFAYEDLDRLVVQLDSLDLLPLDLDAPTVSGLLRRLGEQVLAPRGDRGIDRRDIVVIQSEVFRWLSAQHFIPDYLELGANAQPKSEGAREFLNLIRSAPPLHLDDWGRLEIPARAGGFDQASLTDLNWQRAIIRLLMRGYGDAQNFDEVQGLTQNQLVGLAEDWQLLAVKLGLFDAGEAAKTAKKIFMEGNLFLPSSNGDSRLDFFEAVHYLAYALAGLNAADFIFDELRSTCGTSGSEDTLTVACFRSGVIENLGLLGHLPGLTSFFSENPSRWWEAERFLENTTRKEGYSEEPISRGDLTEMLVLMKFVETFFVKYDLDRTQTINVPETLMAFPVFYESLDQLIEDAIGINFGRGEVRALFTFLFKYGRPPQSTIGGAVKFLNWRWREDRWQYEADRTRLMQILSELNALR